MDPLALQLETRNTIVLADELSRLAHAVAAHVLSGRLAALRSSLEALERDMGRPAPYDTNAVNAVERAVESLLLRRDRVPAALERRFERVIENAERISVALWEPDDAVPSKPVFGLPRARLVPQIARSVFDLAGCGLVLSSVGIARTRRARLVGTVFGIGGGGLALASDTPLGAKRIPIESTVRASFVGGLALLAAPFVLGYARRDPVVAAIHVATGAVGIALACLTDWRGTRGVTTPARRGGRVASPLGRETVRAMSGGGLEGLSSAPTAWPAMS